MSPLRLVEGIVRGVSGFVKIFYAGGRKAVDTTIRDVIPFLALVSLLVGVVRAAGVGRYIGNSLTPVGSSILGLVAISAVVALPALSPILGPGAAVAQVLGSFVGVGIAGGAISPNLALPALFAINAQVGCDFIPVGLALGQANAETIEIGVPTILVSRLLTGPLAVMIGYLVASVSL